MKKLLIVGIIGAVALVAVLKKTNVCSYAGTLVSNVSAEAKNQIPTKFELERIHHEIAELDGDISQMIRPIAEYKSVIEKMRRDIAKKREYEVRLAQLEAEEETLQIARIGSDVKIDSTRATQIEDALAAIEQRQNVERNVIEMRTGELANIPLQERNRTPANLQSI